MLEFPQPTKNYGSIYLEDTDKALPKKIDVRTRYAFFSTIAKGGKSLIKSCQDLHLSRVVCYKTLKPEFENNEIEQQRFLREARVSAMLQHPNTVPTYEVGRDNRGHYYFTMKLVHGYTLREILDYRDRYDLTQLVDVIEQIAQALHYAHTHGVVHRDIKPENILVGPYGEVLLLDWGLAKVWSSDSAVTHDAVDPINEFETNLQKVQTDSEDLTITQHGELQGTVIYMSPEQVRRDPSIDHKTDIYSIGTLLFEILCGRTPFTGEKVYEVVTAIQNDEAVKPSTLTKSAVPSLLEQVTMRCLKKDPAERFSSMAEVVRLLQEDWRGDLLDL